MSVQFIGMIGHRETSEILPPGDIIFDKPVIERFARTHEEAGFDRILIGYWSDQPDGFIVAALAGQATRRLKLLLAHRPGFVSPTLAARKLASLDHLVDGRLAVHVISGGSDVEQRRDGDYEPHQQRYLRTDEYLDVVKRVWRSDTPFDHQGTFYRAEAAYSAIKPKGDLPVYFGGSSPIAQRIAGKHADTYALWGESLAQARETIANVRAEAARHGRDIEFSMSFRPILGVTEAAAWRRAETIRTQAHERLEREGTVFPTKTDSEGARRLRDTVARGDRVDRCLWTGIAALVGGSYNSTALVGTPAQVADALLAYYELGVTTFLIRGFSPIDDAEEYGRELIPLVRQRVAEREAQAQAQAQPA